MGKNRSQSGVTRPAFAVFAIIAIALITASVALLALGTITLWPIALFVVLCSIVLEAPHFRVGSVVHRSPVISLPVIAMLALEPLIPLHVGVGLVTLGVLIAVYFRTRRWTSTLYSAGVAGSGGALYAAIFQLHHAGVVSLLVVSVVASIVYVFFVIGAETIRMTYSRPAQSLGGQRMLSAKRVAIVTAGYTLLATLTALWSHVDLGGTNQAVGVVTVLLALALLAAAWKLYIRGRLVRNQLLNLIAGASAISASQFTETPRRIHPSDGASGTDAATDITELLCRSVSDTVGVESVTVRDEPPRPGELGVAVTLTAGTNQYLVAQRDPMDRAFGSDERSAFLALAHTADVVVKARANIGGLTIRANTDPLTGLPNYGAFQEALANINEHRNYEEALAVLFIDLDEFKRLNDRFGHQVGDGVLHELGRRLRHVVGPHDVVARVGGDEFVVILTRLTSLAEAKTMAEAILAAASTPLTVGSNTFIPVLSIGLAYSAHRETDAAALIGEADRSMLAVKKSRRRGGPANESSISISEQRSSRMNDIVARAIDEDLLELAFQPIVSLVTGQIWGFEALVRYSDEDLGPISPPALVERAKNLGRFDAFTRQVALKAMSAAVDFRLVEPRVVCMAVNVEAGQILPHRLGTFVEDLAARNPDISLCLELNERSVARVPMIVREQADHLRDVGLMIALDDYGSDDSSVDALVRMPMDILKIDRSLVDDLDDIRQREVLTALQGFGDNLEYSMIVEGVENEAMADHLNALGIRSGQGFYYGVPQSYDKTLARLEEFGSIAVLPPGAAEQYNTLPASRAHSAAALTVAPVS